MPQILELSEHLYEVYFGLNDLHLSLGLDFMFESLAGGLVDHGMQQVKAKNLRTGFGGIGRIGTGAVPAEHILSEHVRLGSSVVILSRTFSSGCVDESMEQEIDRLRAEERRLRLLSTAQLERNSEMLKNEIWEVACRKRASS